MRALTLTAIGFVSTLTWVSMNAASPAQTTLVTSAPAALFDTGDRCQACHNGLSTPSGMDVSIGIDWRASMMAHAARDPYWHAGVRREVLDHQAAAAAIEHECSRCHMPMAHFTLAAAGATGQVFAHLPIGGSEAATAALAADGVSCTACHQIRADKLGTPESFTGHFTIDLTTADPRTAYGPYTIDPGLQRLMHSATGFQPSAGTHIQSSEMCATCHTLYTHALDDSGRAIGSLPEQVPYLEWRHSAYRDTTSCQGCHMPVVPEPVRISSTLGQPREGMSRHTFRGANFWMLKVLNRYRTELGVNTLPQELELASRDTLANLEGESAWLQIERAERRGGQLVLEIGVLNRGGHKLPTAYPSRRVWLHVRVTDPDGAVVFESGTPMATGAIAGNDNDADPAAFEPHYDEITSGDQVQIYENIMADVRGQVTTGLLSGVRYVKDNRLLPAGFDKTTAPADVAVHGGAAADGTFAGGGDRVRYRVPAASSGPLAITVELLYQSVGHRWADNLRAYRAAETDRFSAYYRAMSGVTTARLARASIDVR